MSATNEFVQADHFVKEMNGNSKNTEDQGNVLSGK
jgi:hypothetical protein